MEIESQAPRIEELLGHLGWVRALAGRLVADAASADDLVQQTWLAALERPPRHGSNPRGWLARVLKNQLRQGARATRRRGERPFSSTSADAAPEFRDDATPAQLAEEADEQRRLVGLVKALEEPLRSTLLLRYARGWNSARIADHQGVPSGTVRWRLSQGLAQLRDRLDSTHAGDRRAWALAFIPWAQAPTGKSAGLAAGWLAALPGWITMKLVGSLATLAVIALVAWNSFDLGGLQPAKAPPNQAPIVDATLAGAGDSDLVQGPTSDRSSIEIAVDENLETESSSEGASLSSIVSLRFVDEDGTPIPGVRVLDGFGEPIFEPSTNPRSGVDGRVDLDMRGISGVEDANRRVPGPGITSCTWTSRHPEFQRKSFSMTARLGTDVDMGDIVLSPGATLIGRLVDRRGNAVVDGWVEVEELSETIGYDERIVLQRSLAGPQGVEVRTDAEGRFRYLGAPLDGLRLWAGRRGLLAEVRDLQGLVAGEVRDIGTLVLEDQDSQRQIQGTVLDPEGRPAPEIQVKGIYFTDSGPRSSTTFTDAAGRFRFASLHAGEWDLVTVPTGRSPFAGRRDAVPTGSLEVEIHTTPSGQIRVEVVDTKGDLITDETVDVEVVDAVHGSKVADAWLSGIEPGVWIAHVPAVSFSVKGESSRHTEELVGPLEPEETQGTLQIELQPAPGIRGSIELEERTPIRGGVEVFRVASHDSLSHGFPTRLELYPTSQGRLEADGGFEVSLRESGEYALIVSCDGFAPLEVPVTVDDPRVGADVGVLYPGRGGSLEGRLLVEDDARAAQRVIAISRGDSQPRDTLTDGDGWFRFEGLTPGPWQVESRPTPLDKSPHTGSSGSGPPYRMIPSVCEVHEGRVTRYDVDLRSSSSGAACLVTGTLTAPEGSGLWLASLVHQGSSAPGSSPTPRVELDGAGRFKLSSSIPGPHRLTLTRAVDDLARGGLPIVVFRDLELERGSTGVELDITFGAIEAEGIFSAWMPGAWAIGNLGNEWWSVVPLVVVEDEFGEEIAVGRAVPPGEYGIALTEDFTGSSRPEEQPTRIRFEVHEGQTARVVVP